MIISIMNATPSAQIARRFQGARTCSKSKRPIRQFHDDAAQLERERRACPLAIPAHPERTRSQARGNVRGQNGFQVDCGVNFK
jgi:hypothetical protein